MIVVRRELILGDDHFQEIKQTNRALVKGKKQESSKPIILMTGDSWAAGEWNRSLSFDDEFLIFDSYGTRQVYKLLYYVYLKFHKLFLSHFLHHWLSFLQQGLL